MGQKLRLGREPKSDLLWGRDRNCILLGEGPRSDPLRIWNNIGLWNRGEDDIKGSPFSNKEDIVDLTRKLKNAISKESRGDRNLSPECRPLG